MAHPDWLAALLTGRAIGNVALTSQRSMLTRLDWALKGPCGLGHGLV